MNNETALKPQACLTDSRKGSSCCKPAGLASAPSVHPIPAVSEPANSDNDTAACLPLESAQTAQSDSVAMTRHEETSAELEAYLEPGIRGYRANPVDASVHISAWLRPEVQNRPDRNAKGERGAASLDDMNSGAELARARLVFAATLAIPLLLISLSMRLFGANLDQAVLSLMRFAEFLLATHLAVVAATTIYRRAWDGLRRLSPNKHVVYSLGVLVAYGLGVAAFASPETLAAPILGGRESATFDFLVAASLVTVAQFGEWFWTRTQCNVRKAIKAMGRVLGEFREKGIHWPDASTLCHSATREQ